MHWNVLEMEKIVFWVQHGRQNALVSSKRFTAMVRSQTAMLESHTATVRVKTGAVGTKKAVKSRMNPRPRRSNLGWSRTATVESWLNQNRDIRYNYKLWFGEILIVTMNKLIATRSPIGADRSLGWHDRREKRPESHQIGYLDTGDVETRRNMYRYREVSCTL